MKIYTFKLNEQEANLAVAALSKQPFETVSALISKLQLQYAEQIQEPAAQVAPEDVPNPNPEKIPVE